MRPSKPPAAALRAPTSTVVAAPNHPLPAGMRDLLPPEATRRRNLSRRLLDYFVLHGYELVTPPSYLGSLNGLYDEWAATCALCPVLTIPTDGMDFVQCPDDAEAIIAQIQDALP